MEDIGNKLGEYIKSIFNKKQIIDENIEYNIENFLKQIFKILKNNDILNYHLSSLELAKIEIKNLEEKNLNIILTILQEKEENFKNGILTTEGKQQEKLELLQILYSKLSEVIDFGIYKYVEQKLKDFEKEYEKIKDNEEKEKKLTVLEDEIFQFIDDKKYEDKKNIKLYQGGHKELYGLVGDFYKNIGLIEDALDAYRSGTQSSFQGNYKLYGKIAELYKKFKINSITNKQDLIKQNYESLYYGGLVNKDFETIFFALEKLVEIEKEEDIKEEKLLQIKKLFEANYKYFGDNDKVILSYLKACKQLKIEAKQEHDLYVKLANLNHKYLLDYAFYLEEKGLIIEAFINYISNYFLNKKSENSLNAIIIFFEDKILSKKDKDINDINFEIQQLKNDLEKIKNNKQNKNFIQTIKDELEDYKKSKESLLEEKQNLKDDLNKLDELTNQDIERLFLEVLGTEFYETFDLNTISKYIGYYNTNIIKSDIYLKVILEQVQQVYGMSDETLNFFLEKIKNNKNISIFDYYDLKDILESSQNIFISE